MDTVHPVISDDLRVVMCLAFDRRAPASEVTAFKTALRNCPCVVSGCDLTGSFDYMFEASLRHIADYGSKLACIKDQLAKLVERYETNFICKRFVREPTRGTEQVIWVPCHEGLRRVECSAIDKITAEGDYMRLHAGRETWLVHTTLREILRKLSSQDFVHVHRSTVVRCAFIERLVHKGRRWDAKLSDGTIQTIAKSHVKDVLTKLRGDSRTAADRN